MTTNDFRNDSTFAEGPDGDWADDELDVSETDETDLLQLPSHSDDGRLIIRAAPGERRRTHSLVLQCLAETGRIFEQGGTMVRLAADRFTGEMVIRPLTSSDLMLEIDGVAVWERFDARRGEYVRSDPPDQFCNALLRASACDELRPLLGMARQPFLREDGTVCATPGYDPATGLYASFRPAQWSIPAHPTRAQAEDALGALDALLDEFPFVAPSDRSAALAAMLTAAARASLPTAPMFHVRAFAPGTGKTYLTQVITSFASPQLGSPQSFPGSNEECDKLLLAELKQGAPVINFDNLTGDIIPLKKLCTVLTSERVSGRVLGTSRTVDVSTRTLVLASGNNVGPVGDMTRRCITINLDACSDTPEARAFKRPDLIDDVRRHREHHVAAALTVIRAWITAGRPNTTCTSLNSFERWTEWCRQPLLWLGRPDPAASVYEAHTNDPDRQALGELLAVWHRQAGTNPVMVREVIAWADPLTARGGDEALDLRELLEDITGCHGRPINRRSLGWWLKARTGQVVSGMRLEFVARNRNAQSWRVISV